MSINGVLEDLALADLLQFIHLGRRTGTLYMWQDDERRAEIGFHDGRIVNAWTPGQKKLGGLLVEQGLIEDEVLEQALEQQRSDGRGQTIGQILLDRGSIHHDDIYRVFREQVEATIFELVTWRHGRFHFEVDELHPVDEIGLEPEELLGNLDLNTQMVLLEATRLFDERQRQEQGAEKRSEPLAGLDRRLKLAGFGRPPASGERLPPPFLESIRCQVVSDDDDLMTALRDGLPSELVRLATVHLREAGNRMPGESAAPIVLLDLRSDGLTVDDVATLARTRPSASVVAMVPSPEDAPAAHRAGAVSVVAAAGDAVVDCCRNLVRVFSHPQPQGTFGYSGRGGFSRFRRVVFDVQSGLLSATMALNLMNVISESVERAVLFLVQGSELKAVGAFGFSAGGEPLAQVLSGLRFRPGDRSALRRALDGGQPLTVGFAAAELPSSFAALLGPPANDQVVVFPVLGAERPISVIYTDNGAVEEEIQDIKILELATSQVGVAFENELLRQKAGGGFGTVTE
jgi:hypothetical protein